MFSLCFIKLKLNHSQVSVAIAFALASIRVKVASYVPHLARTYESKDRGNVIAPVSATQRLQTFKINK